jgi:hypothetical protein
MDEYDPTDQPRDQEPKIPGQGGMRSKTAECHDLDLFEELTQREERLVVQDEELKRLRLELETNRDRYLEDPRKSEEKYRRLFNGIESPISIYRFVYDDQGGIDHWALEDTNASGLLLLGKSTLEEVVGKNETELFGPNNRGDRLPLIQQLKSNGGHIVKEL